MSEVLLPLVDAHSHLVDSAFEDDLDEVLERARDVGVGAILTVGETLDDATKNLELARRYPDLLRPCCGLYPTVLDLEQAEALEQLIRRERARLWAIGEVGLDRWKVQDRADLELQRQIFSRFIDLAIELDLPLNVHSRSAGERTIALLLERGARRVLLHAFDGRVSKARPAVEAGYFFSVPPSVVRSTQKQKLVERLPLSCLLLETDSPVLGADPLARNEPAEVVVSLRAIADIKGVPVPEVARVTTENACRLFGDLFTV